jgi:hypothetical protein
MLDEAEGEFLPGWDQVEPERNRRSRRRRRLRSVRELAETARVDIMGALAANHLPARTPGGRSLRGANTTSGSRRSGREPTPGL